MSATLSEADLIAVAAKARSANDAAMDGAEKQAELLQKEKEQRASAAFWAEFLATQPVIGTLIGKAIGDTANDSDEAAGRSDASDTSYSADSVLAALAAVAEVLAASGAPVGSVIAAILNTSAAIIATLEDQMGGRGSDASPGDVLYGGDGEGGEPPIAQAANPELAYIEYLLFGADGDDWKGGDTVKTEVSDLGEYTKWGSSHDNSLNGSSGDDKLLGGDGNDKLDGKDGRDYIHGGAGDDTISGGDQGDKLYGGDGYDEIHGDGGNDYIYAGSDGAWANGDDGNDWMFGGDGEDKLRGGADNDHLFGFAGDDDLDGGTGNDNIHGGDDFDTLAGGDGDDLIFGGDGPDTIDGGAGNDVIDAGDGKDIVLGGADDDVIHGGSGQDDIYGEAGDDTIQGGFGADYMDGGSGQDTFIYADVFEFGDEIDGFDLALGAHDTLDFSKIFNGAVANVQQAIAGGYLQWAQNGPDVAIQIDVDGGGDGYVTAVTLLGADATKVADYMFVV